MKYNWKEMNTAQKVEAVVLIALPMLALVFLALDMTGKWANEVHFLLLSLLSLFEAYIGWNKNRKMAILEIVAAVMLAASFFLPFFLPN